VYIVEIPIGVLVSKRGVNVKIEVRVDVVVFEAVLNVTAEIPISTSRENYFDLNSFMVKCSYTVVIADQGA
jgi:hypothetical protein